MEHHLLDHPLLSRDDEQILAQAIRIGEAAASTLATYAGLSGEERSELERCVSEGLAARERFIASNIKLVRFITRRYLGRGLDAEDLAQEGVLGMMHALTKFDPDRGFKFSTYATPWIHQALRRAIDTQGRMIRLPENQAAALAKVAWAREILAEGLGHPASDAELSQATGLSRERISVLRPHLRGVISLHLPVGEDAGELGDLIESVDLDPADVVIGRARSNAVAAALLLLTEIEQTVLSQRYGLNADQKPQSLAATARQLGLSRERVRQIEKRALAKMRHPALLHFQTSDTAA